MQGIGLKAKTDAVFFIFSLNLIKKSLYLLVILFESKDKEVFFMYNKDFINRLHENE